MALCAREAGGAVLAPRCYEGGEDYRGRGAIVILWFYTISHFWTVLLSVKYCLSFTLFLEGCYTFLWIHGHLANQFGHCFSIPHICHQYHQYICGEKSVIWRHFRFWYRQRGENLKFLHIWHVGDVENVSTYVGQIYVVLLQNMFCRNSRTAVWRKIEPKIAYVEKKWQIWGICFSLFDTSFKGNKKGSRVDPPTHTLTH